MNDKNAFSDCFNKFKEYVNSAENINICKMFQEECQRFDGYKKEYQDAADYLNHQCKEKIVREEYGTGGEMLDRGFYYSNPVFDIVVGNCNRGRLLKRITKKSIISFSYGFDASGKLIVVNRWIDGQISTKEYLIYFEKNVLGITFSSEGLMTQICEDEYDDNKLRSVTKVNYLYMTDIVLRLDKDVFSYDESGLKSYDCYSYDPQIPNVNHVQFIFGHDSEGYLSEYFVQEYYGLTKKGSQSKTYLIEMKQKIIL